MRELSLFTGAGGGLLGTKLLGWRHIGYVEINDYCQRVIRQRIADGLLDDAPIFGDIRSFISEGYAESYQGMVDVVTGGFPCQDISAANATGQGIDGEKSGLWREMASIIRIVRPKYVLVENSPALTFRGLGRVLGDLAQMGFDAQWGVLGASHVGAQHQRERIWISADATGERCRRWRNRQNQEHWQRVQLARLVGEARSRETTAAEKARVLGMGDGLANGMDRIKAVGNGQYPAVVRAAWEILTHEMP